MFKWSSLILTDQLSEQFPTCLKGCVNDSFDLNTAHSCYSAEHVNLALLWERKAVLIASSASEMRNNCRSRLICDLFWRYFAEVANSSRTVRYLAPTACLCIICMWNYSFLIVVGHLYLVMYAEVYSLCQMKWFCRNWVFFFFFSTLLSGLQKEYKIWMRNNQYSVLVELCFSGSIFCIYSALIICFI